MKRIELYNDSYQNWKGYQIPKAQLIIADVPYSLGNNAYASNPAWYKDGDNKNGESELAGKQFFNSDVNFKPAEFMHFCSQLLVKEPKNGVSEEELENAPKVGSKMKSQSPCMVLFCAFDQLQYFIEAWKALRPCKIHTVGVQKELFGTGAQGKHEDCRKYGMGISPVP